MIESNKVRDKMIEFVIIDDNLFYINKYKLLIDKIMMNYDIEYDFVVFDKCSKEILKLLKQGTFKIYLLNYNNADQANKLIRYIREKIDDWQSLIILFYITKVPSILSENMFITSVISKVQSLENNLLRSLQICLKNYDQRPNALRYCYKKVFYQIDYKNIIYIEKEQENKRCIIKTTSKEYYIPGTLNKIQSLLDKRFIKCSKSHIINMEQMDSYNKKDNLIRFHDGLEVAAISRNKRKDIINYLRGINN